MSEEFVNSCDLLTHLDAMATMGSNDRLDRLKALLDVPLYERIVKAALDPFITYGIKKWNEPKASGVKPGFDEDTFILLDKLASRDLSGNAAKVAVEAELALLPPQSATLLSRVIGRDLRAGITAKSVNKVKPGTIFVFECMLAHRYESKRIKRWPVVAEPKMDGVRVLCVAKYGRVRIFSRTGKEFTTLQHIAQALETALARMGRTREYWVFDGETVDQSGMFNKIVGDVHRKDSNAETALLMLFDMIPGEEFEKGCSSSTYRARRRELVRHFSDFMADLEPLQLIPAHVCADEQAVMDVYESVRDVGGEGVIVKPLEGLYECKRSYNWLKIKDQQTVDVPIVGFEEGTGKYAGKLGALIVDFNGVQVRVGSGLTDALREEIWNCQADYREQLVEVEYHETTPDGSLRHPRFVRFRPDKAIEDGVGV